MKGWKFILISAAVFVMLFLLLCQKQDTPHTPPAAPALLPGEKHVAGFTTPLIEIANDTECFKDTLCPSRKADCVLKSFVAQKDTTYHLYAVYFNGDTLTPSCRVCASLYQIKASGDTVAIEDLYTACPTGGPWAAHPTLKKDSTYLLSACLHKCGDMTHCNCGEVQYSFAAVSIRDLLPELTRLFR
jgi:hypothetical protein